MKTRAMEPEGLQIIELDIYKDDRGFFVERFNQQAFAELGLNIKFVQDNHSRSKPGVVRGLHYQTDPAQGKLVGVTRGRIYDVAVDIRKDSPTFGKYLGLELSAENGKLLWIPAGFAHGFCVLGEEPADVMYKVDSLYNPKTEGGIHWWDFDLAIDWPKIDPVLSEKDASLPTFKQYTENPSF